MSRLIASMFKKNWYFIPAELSLIPKDRIGSLVETEQAAKHNFREVWINSKIFNKMSEQDQALLLVHEVLVGIKLLPLDSRFHECKSFAPKESYCHGLSDQPQGSADGLTPEDMKAVRAAAVEIMNWKKPLSFIEFEDLLGRYRFRLSTRAFTKLDDHISLSREQMSTLIKKTFILKEFPSIGEQEMPVKGQPESCRLKMTIVPAASTAGVLAKEERVRIEFMRDDGQNFVGEFLIPYETQTVRNYTPGKFTSYFSFNLTSADYWNSKVGDRVFGVYLRFELSDRLEEVNIRESVCVEAQENGSCRQFQTPSDAFGYRCKTKNAD